ncbi:MAG: DUF6446 family protein [Pseudomonadota bacterium]
MNLTKVIITGLLMIAVAAGAALYYLQIYAFYDEVALTADDLQLTSIFTGEPEPILADNVEAIDGDSSPLKFRACFDTTLSFGLLTETYTVYETAEPIVAPPWFDCFDADQIGADLESGVALAFLGTENVQYGIDRIIAIYPDGKGYAWHQINHCGEVVFDGNPAPEDCPPAPESLQ